MVSSVDDVTNAQISRVYLRPMIAVMSEITSFCVESTCSGYSEPVEENPANIHCETELRN